MRKNKRKLRILIFFLISPLILSVIFFFIYGFTIDYSIDEELFSAAKSSNVTTLYYDLNGLAYDIESYSPAVYEEIYGEVIKKQWVSYDSVADSLKSAFVSMEDRNFFQHKGINIKRTVAALFNYIFHFKGSFGGSTITQQVIKNISGDNERSIKRKLNEIYRAIYMDSHHSKEEIFEVYLNVVELGDSIMGVSLAAEHYFGKSASELDYKEAATLVGIANAPTRYNPYNNYDLCKEKRNKVLYSLLECGVIDVEYYKEAIFAEINLIGKSTESPYLNSWFAETVISDVAKDFSEKNGVSVSVARKILTLSGYKIYTTVSPVVQKILTEYFENEENFPKEIKEGLEYSMIVSEPVCGNLIATAGGVGKKRENRILNYTDVPITPGSALKPIALYAPLIDSGEINWASVFDDVPVEFKENDKGALIAYPKNSPNVYDGLTTVKDALTFSKNTVAVRLYNMLGAEKIYNNLYENFGFDTLVKAKKLKDGRTVSDLNASPLALGQLTDGVSLRKLTEAYNVFNGEGKLAKGRSYVAVFDSSGELVLENEAECKEIFKKETAGIMNKLLEGVVESGTAKSISLKEIVDAAGKTGTSGGGKDKIFVGYTPYFTAGIWCGFKNEKRSVQFQGSRHLNIWNEICTEICEELNIDEESRGFSINGLKYLPFCKDSGQIFGENCIKDPRGERMEFGYFTLDNAPSAICERHVRVKYDTVSESIACEDCPLNDLLEISLINVTERSFPYEILVSDAEFVYRELREECRVPETENVPYFYFALPDGVYVGKSKGKKQFNRACLIHQG